MQYNLVQVLVGLKMVAGKLKQADKEELGKKPEHIRPPWVSALGPFEQISRGKVAWQICNTLIPYVFLWYLMIMLIQREYSYGYILLLAIPAAGFLVRAFILFHDCVHDSLFKSKGINKLFGYIFGALVFTPFEDWRYCHLRHHAKYANLDTRGFGDIWTMTRKEFESSPKLKQFQYKLYRNPFVMFGLGAIFIFMLSSRLPTFKIKRRENVSIIFTNLLLIGLFLGAAYLIGWKTYLLIQIPVLWFAWAAGIWLFYVQHQFPGGYWARTGEWDPIKAALEGSSFYKLPAILRWFSGSIGYHHVHHLDSKIPNYQLKKCFDSVPELRTITPLTILKSLRCLTLKMWDENEKKMVGFPNCRQGKR